MNYGNRRSASGGVPRQTATLIGSLSIFFWATWPSLALFAAPAPTFQILAIGQAVGFLALGSIRLIRTQSPFDMLPKSWGMLVFGIIGVLGTNAFNFLAITRIPAAQASVINYTWAVVALLLSSFLGFEILNFKHYVAIILGSLLSGFGVMASLSTKKMRNIKARIFQ